MREISGSLLGLPWHTCKRRAFFVARFLAGSDACSATDRLHSEQTNEAASCLWARLLRGQVRTRGSPETVLGVLPPASHVTGASHRADSRVAAAVTPVGFVETVVWVCLESSDFPGDRPGGHRGDCCKTRDFSGDSGFYLKNLKPL